MDYKHSAIKGLFCKALLKTYRICKLNKSGSKVAYVKNVQDI